MDLIAQPPAFDLHDKEWRIFSRNPVKPPHFAANGAVISNSCVTEGCNVYGTVRRSILFEGVTVEKGAVIQDSIVFPGSVIGKNTVVDKSIVGENTVIGKNCIIGDKNTASDKYASQYCSGGISLIGGGLTIADNVKIGAMAMVTASVKEGE